MRWHSIRLLRQDTLATSYMYDFNSVATLYDYHPYDHNGFRRRLQDVRSVTVRADRSMLTTALRAYNERVNPHPAVMENISILNEADSVAVIGGQQAGLMTGPLYTIYKAITILQLAREMQEMLPVQVVPIFWIAGEDHDLEEVNHIWIPVTDGRLERVKLETDDRHKRSIGKRELVMERVDIFLKAVADRHPDSPYKMEWLDRLRELAERSRTWSDWFAGVFHWLFGEAGLVLFDSAAKEFTQVTAPFYRRLIEASEAIDEAVRSGTKQVERLGFKPQVEMQPGQAHLFIEESGNRSLLFHQDGTFVTKDGSLSYSRNELMHLVSTERLSTNVVTRPLMQEYLFPTLASVLGPGELAYWGQYRQAFSLFGWKMPILFPRIGMTLVERDVSKTMQTFGLSPEQALFHARDVREKWLKKQDELQIEELFAEWTHDLQQWHMAKTRPLLSINPGMAEVIEKNRERLLRELRYLQNQAQQAIRTKYEAPLRRLEWMELHLSPQGKLQERVFNVFYFINQYGWDWLHQLINEPLDLTDPYYMVYL